MTDSSPVPFTEPTPTPCLFTSGAACEFLESFVRIVAWTDMPTAPGEPHERRIVARLVLPTDVARRLGIELRTSLKRSGH